MQMKSGTFFSSQLSPISILAEVLLSVRAESLLWCMATLTFCGDMFGEGSGSRGERDNHAS